MIRIVAMAGGVAGALALSQYPEFSQQYLQRLAGQVDGLTVVVDDFDASALAAGLGREAALREMTGTAFLEDRQADMRATFARHARLDDNLRTLRAAGPFERLMLPHRMADPETLSATWADFAPAVPATTAGAASAAAGFFVGWGGASVLLSVLVWPFRRMWRGMRGGKTVPVRQAPPDLQPPGPRLVSDNPAPLKIGAQR